VEQQSAYHTMDICYTR